MNHEQTCEVWSSYILTSTLVYAKEISGCCSNVLLLFPPIFLQQEVVTCVHCNHARQRAVRKSHLSQASDTHLSLVLYYVEVKGRPF